MARWLNVCCVALASLMGDEATAGDSPPVVVELFTSQSCSSCPPAEALLGELAGRGDVIALEFHVDYWNDLVYGLAGRWVDVHSSPAYTERQRRYAQRLASSVYTPQMVFDGRAEAVGLRAREVERAIAAARRANIGRALVRVAPAHDGLTVRVSGEPPIAPVPVWLVRYRVSETTRVGGGENRGKTLINRHVVTGLTKIGLWPGGDTVIETPLRAALGEGCAVLVQTSAPGPILAAASCPSPPVPAG